MNQTIVVALLGTLMVSPLRAQHDHHVTPAKTGKELDQQIDAVRRSTERYRDHAVAVADGYKRFGTDGPLMGEHWYQPELVRKPLDLTRPATLQYALVDGKRVLIGVAYNVYQRPGEPLPEGFAGADDHWHVHDMPKLARALVADRPFLSRIVERRAERGQIGAGENRSQLVMVHAWVWSENPDGLFAQQHRALPYVRAGLPADWAASADLDAAWGVALLRDGCGHELARLEALAKLSASQRTDLTQHCNDDAATVRRAAAESKSGHTLNLAAAGAWRTFAARRDAVLTTEQKRQLSAVIEPMHKH